MYFDTREVEIFSQVRGIKVVLEDSAWEWNPLTCEWSLNHPRLTLSRLCLTPTQICISKVLSLSLTSFGTDQGIIARLWKVKWDYNHYSKKVTENLGSEPRRVNCKEKNTKFSREVS
jgi:hypothetical protein